MPTYYTADFEEDPSMTMEKFALGCLPAFGIGGYHDMT